MTSVEHQRQLAAVRASLLIAPSRAERHSVYPRRPKPRPVPPRAPQGANRP